MIHISIDTGTKKHARSPSTQRDTIWRSIISALQRSCQAESAYLYQEIEDSGGQLHYAVVPY